MFSSDTAVFVLTFLVAWVIIVLALLSPIFSIWSTNALFGTEIDVTLKTYLAAAWLNALVYGAVRKR